MINKDRQMAFLNKVKFLIKNNIKFMTYFILVIFFLIIIFQYYLYTKNNQTLKLSILYDQTLENVDSEGFIQNINLIAKENGTYGIIASLELIKNYISNKEYLIAYNEYLKLIEDNKSKKIYNSIVSLHGAYSLIEHISSDKIENLLTFVDSSYISFNGYYKEILYLLAIKDRKINKMNELSKKILNDENISYNIKERVRKLDEFRKYK